MTGFNAWRAMVVLWTAVLAAGPLAAQETRDPTIAPGETGDAPTAARTGTEGMTVVVRDGRPYLVVGTRLYAPGDRFGAMRVQRISETEVVLHDGTGLVRMPRFAGIERQALVDKPNCAPLKPAKVNKPLRATVGAKSEQHPAIKATTPRTRPTKTPPAVAPCEDSPS